MTASGIGLRKGQGLGGVCLLGGGGDGGVKETWPTLDFNQPSVDTGRIQVCKRSFHSC